METIDNKSLFVPLTGMYIAFSFDLEKTFDIHRCDLDKTTEQAIRDFSCRKFVGYVSKYFELPMPQREYHRLGIRPLQQGFTIPRPEHATTEDMCVPIFPETKHPLGREPVRTNKPLPWEGSYHPTCMDVCLRIPKGNRDYSSATRLNANDRFRMCCLLDEDIIRRKIALGYVSPPSQEQTPSARDPTPEEEEAFYVDAESYISVKSDYSRLYDYDDSESNYDLDTENKEGEEDSIDGAFMPLLEAVMAVDVDEDYRFTPVINFTTDLLGIESLPNADELDRDLIALERLIKKCREGPPMIVPATADISHSLQDSVTDDGTPTSSWASRPPTSHPRRNRGIKAKLTKVVSRFDIREVLRFGGALLSVSRVFHWRSRKTTSST